MNFHLDTDFGGDPDDFAALLMLLGMPDVRITGITTVLDDDGLRAGAVKQVLDATGHGDIPLCAGARVGLTRPEVLGVRADFWPDVTPRPAAAPGESIATLERSMWMRSTQALIGPYTNGAMFERVRGGLLRERMVVHMGGYITGPAAGYPPLTPADDFNVQWDTRAIEELYKSFANITMVPTPVALQAWITQADVDRIERSGDMGAKLAQQIRTWGEEQHWHQIGLDNAALPDDLAGIMWDAISVLVATGWEGAQIERMSLMPYVADGVMTFEIDGAEGRPVVVVTAIDTAAFREAFLTAIEQAQKQ